MADFKAKTGRRPRILLSKIGQDGDDRKIKVIASAYADFGFDVDLAPLFQTPEQAVKMAIENDVHVIEVFSPGAGHNTLVPQVLNELKKQGASDIKVVAGGIISAQDDAVFKKAGASKIFGPETVVADAAKRILEIIGA